MEKESNEKTRVSEEPYGQYNEEKIRYLNNENKQLVKDIAQIVEDHEKLTKDHKKLM
jgi:hypothetical protein